MLEKLVKNLVPSLQRGDPFFVPAFLYTYRRFSTTKQVLDLFFKRYGFFHDDCEEDEQIKNLICFFLGMWLDKYPDDFCKSEDLAILNQLMAYLLVNMPFSEMTVRVHHLLTQLEDLESTDTQLKHSEETFNGDPEQPQDSIPPGKIQQVISVAEGLEQLNTTG
ncbi:ral guanine nucleotide dissociation stimulator-like [Castor canadensis]|uniref:Ral guanine nucleotide dissociation stimulator-like n=2 Tax=Castor canadensis TaxID=51338 RepID=A0A8B7TJ80_CASCN